MSETKRKDEGRRWSLFVRGILSPFTLLWHGVRRYRYRRWSKRTLGVSPWISLQLEGDVVLDVKRRRLERLIRQALGGGREKAIVLADLDRLIRRLRDLPKHAPAGFIVRLGALDAGWAMTMELRRRIEALKEIAPVHIHIPRSAGNRELAVARAATEISASYASHLAPIGTAATTFFFKNWLDRLGAQAVITSRGRYKSAVEPFSQTERSEADREQTEALVDAIDHNLISCLDASEERARAWLSAGPVTGRQARESELVDHLETQEEMLERLIGPALEEAQNAKKRGRRPRWIEADTVLDGPSARPYRWRPPPRRHVGIVRVHGTIVDDLSMLSQAGDQASEGSVVDDLRVALDDDDVGAVVLHVDSRGGSVSASEGIFDAVRRLNADKPVIACFGDVSASGGYYVGCGARAIYASPMTVTGSIGVFQVLPNFSELVERTGLVFDTITRQPHADFASPWRPIEDTERERLQTMVDDSYDHFVRLVAGARSMEEDAVREIAEGRVWIGTTARERGLLDGLGGVQEAIARAKDEAGGRFRERPRLVIASRKQTDQRPRLPPERAAPGSPGPAAFLRAGSALAHGLGLGSESAVVRDVLALWSIVGPRPWYYAPIGRL